jgi:hypothetical protein
MPLSPEPEKLELTLARIHKLLSASPESGEELRAGCAELVDTHQPGAFRMVRFEAKEDAEPQELRDGDAANVQPVMALRRLRPPVRATVEMKDGFPMRVTADCLGAARGYVVWAAGPWRTSGEWWLRGEVKEDLAKATTQPWARDEWDVAIIKSKVAGISKIAKAADVKRSADEVALFRMVREIESGAWWVEAGYD